MSRPYSLAAVAALFLERQHLTKPRSRRLTAAKLVHFVETTGGLQLDSINVVERAHYLTIFSRFGTYDRRTLDRMVYRRKLLFEYWAHAACLVARAHLPAWRRVMVDYGHDGRGWPKRPRKYQELLAEVTTQVRDQGPLGSADFEGVPKPQAAAGWWNWKPTTRALDHLWMSGVTMVHSRVHFHKRYDLAERVLPEVASIVPGTIEEFRRWHLRQSLHAMGAATETDLRMYLTFPKSGLLDRKRILAAMVASGEVVEIPVEHRGTNRPPRWFLLAEDLEPLARAGRRRQSSIGTTLLSPFDSLLWHRDRIRRLFGFDYALEVYTPGPKRVHGYYSLPILHDGQLVGRVDAKTHRTTYRLELVHVHFEPWVLNTGLPPAASWGAVSFEAVVGGLVEAVKDLAAFVGARQIAVGRVTPAKAGRLVRNGFRGDR